MLKSHNLHKVFSSMLHLPMKIAPSRRVGLLLGSSKRSNSGNASHQSEDCHPQSSSIVRSPRKLASWSGIWKKNGERKFPTLLTKVFCESGEWIPAQLWIIINGQGFKEMQTVGLGTATGLTMDELQDTKNVIHSKAERISFGANFETPKRNGRSELEALLSDLEMVLGTEFELKWPKFCSCTMESKLHKLLSILAELGISRVWDNGEIPDLWEESFLLVGKSRFSPVNLFGIKGALRTVGSESDTRELELLIWSDANWLETLGVSTTVKTALGWFGLGEGTCWGEYLYSCAKYGPE